MVDPNPARGMPLQLQRYWLAGKGAAKIRWNTPGDFLRCVRQLTKYFPTDPKGLCNILHQKATGGPPGHGSAEHALTAASKALFSMQELGPMWVGPLAPINRPTGEPLQQRLFEPGALDARSLPLPLAFRKISTHQGHSGAVTVGRILGTTIGPDHQGQDYVWGWGDWLSEDIVPEVKEARYLNSQGVLGPSLDPGGQVVGTMNPESGVIHFSRYTLGGATLVAIPAFTDLRLFDLNEAGDWDDEEDMVLPPDSSDCGCGEYSSDVEQDDPWRHGVSDVERTERGAGSQAGSDEIGLSDSIVPTFAVNGSGWRGLPLAPREAIFDNDDAVKRITAWAAQGSGRPDPKLMSRMFMWYDSNGNPSDPTSYRLPLGDIISGKPTMVYHAIYAAAALLSGAHGGLPNVPDEEKGQLRGVISEIYPEMATAFNDANIKAPWDQPADVAAREQGGGQFAVAEEKAEPYGNVQYADPGYRDNKKRYPIDTPEHIRAAWSYINVAKNAAEYTPEQVKAIKAKIVAAAKKAGIEISGEMSMGYPLYPPKEWFDKPKLDKLTPLTVEPDGRVYGHLAAWDTCHRDVSQNSCMLAPRTQKDYEPFHLGTVFTAEGEAVRVGKIVMDTRHASINLNYRAAAIHYDDTGDEVAVVRAYEDQFGPVLAGAVVPEADERKVAKLRRSPLSGDWRAVDGNLELTAALAVNVPAFPVFSMDGDERLALVAAGTVVPDYDDVVFETLDGEEFTVDTEDEAQEDRAWELRAIIEEHDNWNQWKRASELAAFAAATGAPAVDPGPDPLYGDQAMLQRQNTGSFQVSEDTGAGTVPTPVG